MNASAQNQVSTVGKLAKIFLDEIGTIDQVDTLGVVFDNEITDETLADVPSFAEMELTKAEYAATLYVLKLIRQSIQQTDYPSFVKMANLP